MRVVPDHVRPANARARTSVVDEVASICRDVLGSDHIGLRDDLFDLGVDATAAMRILAHLEAKLAVQIPLPMLFELEPTIERLAIEIEHRRAVAVGESPAEVAKATSPEQLASLREGVRHRLLFQWNGTSVDYGKDRTLTSLFEEQVARTPDAIAVQFEDRRLSYRELSVASNRVAAHLHRAGAHPGALVGIYLERSSDLVVAILGVLKAGCAYVPIDPELPSARAARIVADALPQVVLTRRQLRHRLPKGPPNVLDVEQCTRDSSATSAAPLPAIAPDAPACVLYSPGWFDCPIGVVVAHRSIVNVIEWITSTLETSPRDVFLQSASASVAASLYELYAAWTVGAKLVVLPPDAHRDSRWLLEIAKREGVTILQTSGAMLQGLLDEPSFARLESLRCVCSHGDALGEALVERLLGSHPARLFSVDEPSETCGATYHEYVRRASSGDARGHARVGRAFPNTQLYVLDEHLEPLPLGLAGELFVGGAGEPLDYHAQPSLSAGRFVRDPFAPEDGRRLFRTGERATRRGDGTIERVAQLDDAVDVGGYRVKLSDLDAILLQDHRVREAAVVARARTSGGTQLTGYVACEGPSSPCASDLQRVLMNVLPEVLSEIVFLEALPRTTDGRIDRTALIVTSARETASVVAYVAPRDSIEERLANVFSQMLRIEKVGVNDDFFALGGHSLVAMQLVNRIFTLMGTELPIRALFEAPTVAGLAARIKAGPSAADAPPLVRTEIEGGTVLSFWQESTLTWERKRPPTATWTGGLRIRFEGVLDVASLTRAIETVLEAQEALRHVLYRDPTLAPHLCEAREIPVPLVEMHGAADEEVAKVVGERASGVFALDGTPLVRFLLVRRADDEHTLYCTWHHLVHDGQGAPLLAMEILETYRALVEKRAPRPTPVFRYTDFAAWERAWFSNGGSAEVEAARARIAGVRALNLPTDRQRSAISTSRGHFASVTLDVAESERFAQLCQSAHVTAFMGVVAVLGMHVGQWCGSDDVVLISPMGTRVREDMRALAGSIANWIPLRVSLAGDPSVRDVLLRVRLDATQAYAHAAVPAALVYETPDLYAHPLGRVLVNMPAAEAGPTEAPEASIEMAGLTAFAEDDTPRPALCRTDLTFHVTRVDNRIDVRVRGDADLFDAATIAGCAARVGELLRTVTLDARVSSLR